MSAACQRIVPEASQTVPDPHSATSKQQYLTAWTNQADANYDCIKRRAAFGKPCEEACKNLPRAEDFLENADCAKCLEDADRDASDERCMVQEMVECLDKLVDESHPFDFRSNEATRDRLISTGFEHRQPFDDVSRWIFYVSLTVLFVCLILIYAIQSGVIK